jgi:hypothetical protein
MTRFDLGHPVNFTAWTPDKTGDTRRCASRPAGKRAHKQLISLLAGSFALDAGSMPT